MPFVKGQIANPHGTQKNKRWDEALTRAIAQDDSKRLRQAAEKLLDFAAEGEQWAVLELANRLDGKSPQGLEVTGAGGGAVIIHATSHDVAL